MSKEYSDLMQKTLSEELVYDGKLVKLYKNKVELPDGRTAVREIVRHGGGAGALVVDERGFCHMVRQFRPACEKVLLEIPAGKIEPGESPLECISREITEETGYCSDSIKLLAAFYPTPGYVSEKLYVYLAENIKKRKENPDEDEFLEGEVYSYSDLYEMAKSGQIEDAKTEIAVLLAADRLREFL